MINKSIPTFLLILCTTFFIGLNNVSAQTTASDRVLVSGKKNLKQSDINKLIEFYEWAFETGFTDDEREKFQQNTENEFRKDPVSARQTIDDINTTLPKILASSTDVQQETRKNFLEAFVPEMQKDNDENSQLLLSIYENSKNKNQAKNSGENNSIEAPNSTSQSVGNISALVGKWVWGRSGSMTTSTSGVYLGGNASRHTYQFLPNGIVEYTGIMTMMTGGCKMQVFRTAKGKASINGNKLTVNWQPASFSRDDSCSPAKNYKKTMPAETETFQISFKDSYGQKQLCLTNKDETCFSKE